MNHKGGSWIKEFDERFPLFGGIKGTPLKQFIKSLLAQERKRAYKEGFNEGCKGWLDLKKQVKTK